MAWGEIAPLVAARARPRSVPAPLDPGSAPRPREPLLELHSVSHQYGGSSSPVLRDTSFMVEAGDRLLLLGPSGCGKSTLALVMGGLEEQKSGLILYRGLDRASLGQSGWRQAIALAPQFHQNHVFSGTLLFNLFLGNWPPSRREVDEAIAVCDELGLGDLIERMPAGLQQHVGETGWQLSHGERSRLFIARALLQRAPLVILDESFGALDPATATAAMACARRRTCALVVVAHP
jgi:ATP-binding cassette, subfamily B, bacterial